MSGSEPMVSAEMVRSASTPDTAESRRGRGSSPVGHQPRRRAELLYDHTAAGRYETRT